MWVLVALSSLAVLIILALCLPLDLLLRLEVYGKPRFRVRLAWLFGLVDKEIRKGKRKARAKRKAVEGQRRPKDRRGRVELVFNILRTKGLLPQLLRLLRNIVSCLHIRDLKADFRVGLDNPADTGFLFAFIGPATLLMNSSFPCRTRVQPDFGAAVLEGYLCGTVRLQPIQLVTPVIRFVFSSATLRVAKKLMVTKWKRRK